MNATSAPSVASSNSTTSVSSSNRRFGNVINEFLSGLSAHATVGDGSEYNNYGASGPAVCEPATGGQMLF